MEENKLLVVIVAIVSIAAIFSIVTAQKVQTVYMPSIMNDVPNMMEDNTHSLAGQATKSLLKNVKEISNQKNIFQFVPPTTSLSFGILEARQ